MHPTGLALQPVREGRFREIRFPEIILMPVNPLHEVAAKNNPASGARWTGFFRHAQQRLSSRRKPGPRAAEPNSRSNVRESTRHRTLQPWTPAFARATTECVSEGSACCAGAPPAGRQRANSVQVPRWTPVRRSLRQGEGGSESGLRWTSSGAVRGPAPRALPRLAWGSSNGFASPLDIQRRRVPYLVSRLCTAGLCSSRRASAATQRAALLLRAAISWAQAMAARFSRRLRLPICRSAQDTAFAT
jgi:hypothetical protein